MAVTAKTNVSFEGEFYPAGSDLSHFPADTLADLKARGLLAEGTIVTPDNPTPVAPIQLQPVAPSAPVAPQVVQPTPEQIIKDLHDAGLDAQGRPLPPAN